MRFFKMHGLGNDYVFMLDFDGEITDPSRLAVKLSARRTGIGSDGLILIGNSKVADFEMAIFNADGSRGKTCGNGLRCVGKLLFDRGFTEKKELKIQTLAGIKRLFINAKEGVAKSVRVQMGAPVFLPSEIPVGLSGCAVISRRVEIEKPRIITALSMGNPHCVQFFSDVENVDLQAENSAFEKSGLFKDGVNLEFAKVIGNNELYFRVFERGSGETTSCGTGACAVAVAAVVNGLANREKPITVWQKGGKLTVDWKKEQVWLTGEATFVFEGEIAL